MSETAMKVYNDMITPPINLSRLDLYTGGDSEDQAALLTVFIETSQHALVQMEQAFVNDEHDTWRRCVHMLKGSASTIGADELAKLCAKAEHHYSDSSKRDSLRSIRAELQRVQVFIEKIRHREKH